VRVAVYTIALNEAAHAERWAESAVDADYRIVADTGSTDDTVELLTSAGVMVHRIAVRPWRFDVARNTAMALIPFDVDVCCTMDMDRFLEPGWRPRLEAADAGDDGALLPGGLSSERR
jgi:glycosyltransferase involved in cell wall biosynthesis